MDSDRGIVGYSALEQLRQVEQCLEEGRLGDEVVRILLPGGCPLADETALWDYKITLPTPDDAKETGESFQALLHDVVKDVISFHNSHGGYIIAGVKNGAVPSFRSFYKDFDCHELAKPIYAVTGERIDCRFECGELAQPWGCGIAGGDFKGKKGGVCCSGCLLG